MPRHQPGRGRAALFEAPPERQCARRWRAQVGNCKVHGARNIPKKSRLQIPSDSTHAEVVSKIKKDFHSIAANSMYEGVGRGGGPIHEVLQDLFIEKYEDEQPAFTDNYGREMTGTRKGHFSRGSANPGLPNDTNALEAFNNAFKEDATVRKQFSIDGGNGIM